MLTEGASQEEILSRNLHHCITSLKPQTQLYTEIFLHSGPL